MFLAINFVVSFGGGIPLAGARHQLFLDGLPSLQLYRIAPFEKHASNHIMIEYIFKFKIPVSILSPVGREEGPSPKQKELIFMAVEGGMTGKDQLQNSAVYFLTLMADFSIFTLQVGCRPTPLIFLSQFIFLFSCSPLQIKYYPLFPSRLFFSSTTHAIS